MQKKDIEHLATLSRIELTEKEKERLAGDITHILEYVSAVDEIVAETGIEKRVGALSNVMREDTDPHEPGMYTEELLNAAPERDGRYVKVKKILGGE